MNHHCLWKKKPDESIAVSLSASAFLKMGHAVAAMKELADVALEEFDISAKSWNDPVIEKFLVEKTAFAKGGFRNAFLGKCIGGRFKNRKFVIKKYRDEKVSEILQTVNETEEVHVRKVVQMHMVARNFAKQLQLSAPYDYGEHLYYEKKYFTAHYMAALSLLNHSWREIL